MSTIYVGDKVKLKNKTTWTRTDYWEYQLPKDEIITITGIVDVWGSGIDYYSFDHPTKPKDKWHTRLLLGSDEIELLSQEHQCRCPLDVLMSIGCQCGGN